MGLCAGAGGSGRRSGSRTRGQASVAVGAVAVICGAGSDAASGEWGGDAPKGVGGVVGGGRVVGKVGRFLLFLVQGL